LRNRLARFAYHKEFIIKMIILCCSAHGFKELFATPATRAFPVFGQILEFRAFGHAAFFIAFIGNVNIPACCSLALAHFFGVRHDESP
jgi:hypothetical protein